MTLADLTARPRSIVAVSLVVAAAALACAPSAHGQDAPSTCPSTIEPLSDADAERVWSIASDSLVSQASTRSPITFPFGSTGKARTPRRTNALAWTAGFFPAALWLAYADRPSTQLLGLARQYTSALAPAADWTGTHDLGFMVGLPTRLGEALDPDDDKRAGYSSMRSQAAKSLATRWNSDVGAIKSGDYEGKWGVIIDSAMNAPLLIDEGQRLGGAAGDDLRARGVRHMLLLAEDFIRPDGSTIHRQAYDPRTGRLLGPIAGQGASTSSTWARGQAWAIAGFSEAYALTGNHVFLDAARSTADYWRAQVPDGCVPAWDFQAAKSRATRDSSAAAIASYGMLELADAEPDAERAQEYRSSALATLGTLASSPWTREAAANSGLLQRQSYNVPADPREGSYAWGDAYLLLALANRG